MALRVQFQDTLECVLGCLLFKKQGQPQESFNSSQVKHEPETSSSFKFRTLWVQAYVQPALNIDRANEAEIIYQNNKVSEKLIARLSCRPELEAFRCLPYRSELQKILVYIAKSGYRHSSMMNELTQPSQQQTVHLGCRS